ncbi:uncharacterized protein LOC120781432 [Bactrocera tryoni]|uniref:uncharacterized protein LOC120781432 n=1 Tax=Bactrocera tryoni TaxID=59916 RepID=UPI001A957246|nr:uncharacterized protein LOC120781432 [Bactrocera tryoni]
MGENVQCPVCTLFLHAGMNLSDHLETHPKEQVIKALVQMTISGSGGSAASTALAASLSGGSAPKADPDEKPIPATISTDSDATSNSATSGTSNFAVNDTAQISSQSFANAFCGISAINKPSTSTASAPSTSATLRASVDVAANANNKKLENKREIKTDAGSLSDKVQVSVTTAVPANGIGQVQLPGQFDDYAANRYHQMQQKQLATSQLEQRHQQQQQQQKNQLQKPKPHMDSASAHIEIAQQRNILPPPPPPMAAMPLVVGQVPNKLLHQSHSNNLFASNAASHRHIQMHPIQQPHPQLQHQYQQQQHAHNQQQQQQQQQNLKIYYSAALPTPPPTLFPFHASTQLQHQKPPPAYGTAISQIRSQNNQNKNKHATTDKNHIQQQHLQLQQQSHQQQQHHQQLTRQIQQRVTMHATQSQALANCTPSLQQLHQHHQQHTLANIPTANAKATMGTKPTELLPPPPPPTRTPTNLHQLHQQQLPHTLSHFGAPVKAMPAVQQRVATDVIDVSNAATSQTLPPSTTVTASAATTTPAIVTMSSSPGMRQIASPYNALLMTAVQSPSSSSVLRYAESPVAHYLERDNGDFIVQETPKHIVECVEKDNGEFSVIERIYQSPLSVLHIHEDNEKEDDDDDDADGDNGDIKDNDSKKVSTIDDTAKANEVIPMDIECEENLSDEQLRKANKSQVNVNAQVKEAETSSNKSTASADGKVQTKIYGSDKSDVASASCSSNTNTNCDRTTPQHCTTSSAAHVDVSSDPSSSSNSSANVINESNMLPSCSTTNANQTNNAAGTSRKRSSKNTITVLSDVQLNLDEYLDLVGNIIASSKITAKSNTLPSTMPIPLLKVEKEEPPDDDYEVPTPQQEQEQHKFAERKPEFFETQKPLNDFQASTVIEPPTIANNKNETEKIVENNCSSNKVRINDSSDNVKPADNGALPTTSAAGTAMCSSHVTSVIRMATTSQQQQTQKDMAQQPTIASDATGTQSRSMFDDEPALAAQSQVTSIIIQDLSRQHIIQLQDEQNAHNPPRPLNPMEDIHGFSQPQVDLTSKIEEQSLLHTRAPTSTTLPVQKRGPKKLIIKPKATKTDANANYNSNNINSNCNRNVDVKDINSQIIIEEALCEQPTTSTKAQMEMQEKIRQSQQDKEQPTHHTIAQKLIKSEPSSSAYDSNTHRISINGNQNLAHSILENHLTSNVDNTGAPIIQCKTEQVGGVQEAPTNFLQPFKEEDKDGSNSNDNAATDDARVLLDFANSKKHEAPHNVATNFLSASSIFSNTASKVNAPKPATLHPNSNTSSTESHAALRCEDEFIAHDDVQEVVISSSYSQSQSASDVPTSATSSTTTSHVRDLNLVQQQQQQQHHHQQLQHQQQQQQQQHLHHNFTDYPFSFLYGHGGSVSGAGSGLQAADSKGGNFSAIYQQAAQDATTAATLASGSNTIHTDDSTSSTQQQQTHTNHFGGVHGSAGEMGSTASHWYHHALATANADFEAALAVDCNAAVDGGDVGKYLDLDTCKREVLVGMPGAPSSTSSSFAAATESSLAGGCTADALNIRTDEKMPAKGEISGQESNCDIENSWSQPMYGEISARFFKTTFPGIFQHENGWNHDEYFTVQDLSASAAATGTAPANRSGKSFDFRLPLEATTSAAANATGSGNSNFQLFARHTDVLPSTSTSNKKKRKRDSHGGSGTATGRVEKATVSRVQPTATITSQQLLLPQPQSSQQLQAHEQLQQLSQNAESATSSAAAAAATNGTPTLGADQRRQRKKVYQCTHCTAEFPKLKDRNSHMILQHNYVRQNRRLICVQRPDAAVTAPDAIPSSSNAVAGGVDNVVVVNMAEGCSSSLVRSDSMEFLEDSKQDIVKIEVENAYQPLAAAPPAVAATVASTSTAGNSESVDAKPELVDDKQGMPLLPASNANIAGGVGDVAGDALDTKPLLQPLAMTTPATKLAALYRMLVSYNISTLKDSHNLSEMEQKLIEQSIFFCYVCRRNFTSVKLYDAHLSEHPAQCFTCGKTFQRWKNFSLHLKRHLGWKEFGCNVCEKKFVVRSALVEHMRMHTGHTPLKCKVCGKYFKRYSNLTQHRKRHGKQIIRKKEYVCHCGEVLPSKARFLWHKETHDAKPKCCPYCCDRFVHANSLRRHIRLAHSDKFDYAEPMECPLCKQTFAKSSIKAHMATHSMDTQHDCAICNKSFSTKWNLKIHSWVHANRTSKPFKCEHCPKAFVREVDFKNHMNAHKQIKPYTCEYCGCKFIRKYNYMRHRREHHGNKKFTCDLCKKSFHRHYYLIEHRRIHTGERPFQCTICGKSSTTKTNHNKHLKIHHSRDPFTVEA